MLYEILKLIIRFALRIFFKEFEVKGCENLPEKGPLIVVSNHPSTLMDPLVVASCIPQQVYFIAKGSLFNTPFKRKVLKIMHAIPIYRPQDLKAGAGIDRKAKNETTFRMVEDFLGQKGTIIIFPEGTSILERRLQKIKTGTARIALGAEAKNDFGLDLKILTVGLNYSNARRFRSELYVKIDEAITVKDYQNIYEEDNWKAVEALTETIRRRLEANVIVTQDEKADRLSQNIETLYQNQLIADLKLDGAENEQEFRTSQGIADAVAHFRKTDPKRMEKFEERMENYMDQLQSLQLKDDLFIKDRRNQNIITDSIKTMLYFMLGLPVYLYGLINNYIPYKIPSLVADNFVKVAEYRGPVMMLTGMLTFPLFYFLQSWFVAKITGGASWLPWLYFISLPVSGFFVLHYWGRLLRSRDHWKMVSLFYRRNKLVNNLIVQRAILINELEKAKVQYLDFLEKEQR